MTEQEKYYIRKNKQAEDIDEAMGLLLPSMVILFFGWLLIAFWPVTLFFCLIALIVFVIKNIKDTMIQMYTTLYNFLFNRKSIKTDTLNLLDALVILFIIFFGIVLAISITLN